VAASMRNDTILVEDAGIRVIPNKAAAASESRQREIARRNVSHSPSVWTASACEPSHARGAQTSIVTSAPPQIL
jgi:hypothetical protein